MTEAVAVIILAALVKKLVDFGKLLTDKDYSGALVQVAAWAAGWLAVGLVALGPWADEIRVASISAADLGVVGVITAGLLIGSTGSVLYDYSPSRSDS